VRSVRREALIVLVLVLATAIAYAPVLLNDFVNFDDALYVRDNPSVRAGLTARSVRWAWTALHAGYYQPLTWMSFQLDTQLFGTAPWGYHLTNLLWHVANVVLLFGLLRRLTGALWRSAAVAALFAVHPLHVESVAWVTERKDVLSTFFALLTIWAYQAYAVRRAPGWYLCALVALALGLMAKPMLVTLPCVLLLLDYWPLCRWPGAPRPLDAQCRPTTWRALVWEKLPLFILAALFSGLTIYAQHQVKALVSLEQLPLSVRWGNALVACIWYLAKTLWPSGLAPFYPYSGFTLPWWQVSGAAVLLLGSTAGAIVARRGRPYLAVGWLWFLGTLVPVLGLFQAGAQPWADRFTYLPHIGLFLWMVWGAHDLLRAWSLPPAVPATGMAVVLVALMVCTWLQVRRWTDSVTLLEHTLRVTQANPEARNALGGALLEAGQVGAAIRHLREALQLAPDHYRAHYNLGVALERQGDREAAVRHYREALRIQPKFVPARYNLGVVLASLGQREAAIEQFEAAIELGPTFVRAHFNLAMARAEQGNREAAIQHFRRVLEFDPGFTPTPHAPLGMLLFETGQPDEAILHLQAAIRRARSNAGLHHQLGAVLASQQKWAAADACFRQAVRLEPEAISAYCSLARALGKQGQPGAAAEQYRHAFRLSPNWPQVAGEQAWHLATHPYPGRRNGLMAVELAEPACEATRNEEPRLLDVLASAYAEVGQYDRAATTAQRALALALAKSNSALAEEVRARQKLYEARRPFRTAAPAELR
jgi:tetratricopeptide (TPR) repeat protein